MDILAAVRVGEWEVLWPQCNEGNQGIVLFGQSIHSVNVGKIYDFLPII